MIQITPVQAGFPLQEATHFNLIPIISSTTATSCNTRWQLFKEVQKTFSSPTKDENNQIVMIDKIQKSYILLSEGNHPINEAEYSAWGADNEYLEDLVLTALNLTRL